MNNKLLIKYSIFIRCDFHKGIPRWNAKSKIQISVEKDSINNNRFCSENVMI